MKSGLYNSNDCTLIHTLDTIGGKWRIQILWHLSFAPLRYNEMKRRVEGITNLMLTRSLRDMETAGWIERKVKAEKPLHVEYSLTLKTRELIPLLLTINEWGKKSSES